MIPVICSIWVIWFERNRAQIIFHKFSICFYILEGIHFSPTIQLAVNSIFRKNVFTCRIEAWRYQQKFFNFTEICIFIEPFTHFFLMINIFTIFESRIFWKIYSTRIEVVAFISKKTATLLNSVCSRFADTVTRHICNSQSLNSKPPVEHICTNKNVGNTAIPIYIIGLPFLFVAADNQHKVSLIYDIWDLWHYLLKCRIIFTVALIFAYSLWIHRIKFSNKIHVCQILRTSIKHIRPNPYNILNPAVKFFASILLLISMNHHWKKWLPLFNFNYNSHPHYMEYEGVFQRLGAAW